MEGGAAGSGDGNLHTESYLPEQTAVDGLGRTDTDEAPRLPVLGEVGYLPLDNRGEELLFQNLSKCYEWSSTVITTNIA